ncbi:MULTISPECIES: hypothetical protein [unclassified Vibrio]|uniref:hypothetical protein n=1 Tax=unclassified Vibrio TaxID=2614977 RepID=UPI0010BDC079|nr:hypothetical protein [Vibrio sp. F13]TKG30322.1 hypothetical protein FCV85_13115 [Vibrio sp. F13]
MSIKLSKDVAPKLLFLLSFLFCVTYSWYPVVVCFVLSFFLFIVSIRQQAIKDFNLALLIILSGLIFFTIRNMEEHIDYLYSLLSIALLFCSYVVANYLGQNPERWLYFVKCLFSGCLVVVIFTFIVAIPQDIDLFLGERRGYLAYEFLFFGRKYEFSFGVTHLNIFINFMLAYAIIGYNIIKSNRFYFVVLFLLLFFLSMTTQSRSPLLFVFSSLTIVKFINIVHKRDSMMVSCTLTLGLFFFLICTSFAVISFLPDDSRFLDGIRFMFFSIGIEHLIEQPWGNSLIYYDVRLPLSNYHNTFLSMGNRFSLLFLFIILFRFIYSFYHHVYSRASNYESKVIFVVLSYFCFHNFMIEDVFKFEKFVVFLFFVLVFSFNKFRFKI